MSWSVNYVGTPEKVCVALDEYGSKLDGPSKEEFDEANPHIQALLKQNFSSTEVKIVNLSASGSGYKSELRNSQQCAVKIEPVYGQILI